jgi:ribosomal protein L3
MNPKSGWTNYGLVKGGAIIVSGSVPGPRKRLIMLSAPRRKLKYEPSEIKNIMIK